MEIKTTKERDAAPQPLSGPEKSRYLRRPQPQKIRKPQGTGFIARGLRFLGKAVVLVLAVASVASILVFAFTSERLTLRNVTIRGCERADPHKLEAIVREHSSGHILRIDLAKLRARLEAEPWVRRAELRRMLPSDVVVYVQERVPSVVVELGGQLMVADEEGILLDNYDDKSSKLDVPVFKGLLGENAESYRMYRQENSERVRLGSKLLSDLESGSSAFTSEISEVDLSDKANVKLLLVDEPPEISIGDRDFLKRFRTLMANMSQYREIKTRYNEISSVDLRYEGQIVYRPRQVETAEAQQ